MPGFASFWILTTQQVLNKYLLNKWANERVNRIPTSCRSEYSLVWVETQQSTRSPTGWLFASCFHILFRLEYVSLHMVLIYFCWENSSICNSNQWLQDLAGMENFLSLCYDLYSDYSDCNSWPFGSTSIQWSSLSDWSSPVAFPFSERERSSTKAPSSVLQYPRGTWFSNHQNLDFSMLPLLFLKEVVDEVTING